MLDSTHSVRLIGALDNMKKQQITTTSADSLFEEFRNLYFGLAFARGGVAPITTRISALIDMVALLQDQSFETHHTPQDGLTFLRLDDPQAPVELARKTIAMSGIYARLYDPEFLLRDPW